LELVLKVMISDLVLAVNRRPWQVDKLSQRVERALIWSWTR